MILLPLWPHKRDIAKYRPRHLAGFSLIEMAIVLVILGFLLGGLMGPLSSQHDLAKRRDAQTQLEEIREALLGYAQANGALPCPASATSNGVAQFISPASNANPLTTCSSLSGVVPYTTLGFQGPLSSPPQQQLLDPWNNPIRYSLTNAKKKPPVAPAIVGPWKYATATIALVGGASDDAPNLKICSASTCTAPAQVIASNVVAVLLSTGDNQAASPNQILNKSGGTDFVMNNTNSLALGSEFDDIVVWISQPELIYALSKTK